MKTCFFIGHRDTPDTIFPTLLEAVDRHITVYGVTDFVAGHYGRFDALAAQAVRAAKKRRPSITLTLLVPYYSPDRSAAALLAKCATKGYILADLYDLDSIQAYPITPGQEYTIRDYTVLIGQRENAGGVSITVQGHLFDDGE